MDPPQASVPRPGSPSSSDTVKATKALAHCIAYIVPHPTACCQPPKTLVIVFFAGPCGNIVREGMAKTQGYFTRDFAYRTRTLAPWGETVSGTISGASKEKQTVPDTVFPCTISPTFYGSLSR